MPPETKYASEGGPTFKDRFALLRDGAARPAADVLKLLDAAIFNLIAGNADAHGKSFSILYDQEGPRLASLYDLLATVAYPELSPKLAMKIGKRAAFAVDTGIGVPLIRRGIAEISESVRAKALDVAADLMMPGLDEAALMRLADLVSDRAAWCARTIRWNAPIGWSGAEPWHSGHFRTGKNHCEQVVIQSVGLMVAGVVFHKDQLLSRAGWVDQETLAA